jgi:hypothetical protein
MQTEVEGYQEGNWVYLQGPQGTAPRLRIHVAAGMFIEDLSSVSNP